MKTPFGTGSFPALVIAVVVSTPALVQSSGDAVPDSTVMTLETVVVTGARIPATVLRVPAAVSLVSRDRLVSTRQISLAEGLSRVPGVFSQSRGGAQDVRITIRGYGARGNGERSNAGNMRGIRVLTDGIPLTEPDGRTSLELVDLGAVDRVEVLRSNGSVLYGNASGGVVNLRTSSDFDRPYYQWQARGGSFGFHREQAIIGYTLGGARGTVSVYNSNLDGWRAHSGSTTTSVQNRVSAPIDENSRLGLLLDFVSNLNRYPGALTQSQLDANPEQANQTFVRRDERRFNRVGRVGITFDRHLQGSQSLSLAAWVEPKVLQRSERGRFRDFNRYHVGGSATWQIETPLSSGWHATWTAGADEQYQDGSIQFFDLLPDGSRKDTVRVNKREGANSAGGFLQGELSWHDQWFFRLAGRYDNLWYLSEDRFVSSINATKHFTQITPKGSIARYFDRHTVYASVGGGVEAPAFNEIDPPPSVPQTSLNPFLEPMRSTSYEVGAKGDLAAEGGGVGHLQYDAAFYWIDVVNDIVPFNGGQYFFTAGKSRRRGAELGLDWAPVSALTLGGAVTLTQNEYLKYKNDIDLDGDGQPDDFAGKDVAGLPSVFFDAEVKWRVVQGLSLGGTVKHVGEYFADDANRASVRAFAIVGAGVEYVQPVGFGLLRAFVAGDNLTDRDYIASVFINGINSQYYEPGLPRNFSVGLGVTVR
jgi:iron complex outermembrane receptor protein